MEELRGVAQFGSAPALGAGCRRFESCHPDCKTSQSSTDISAAFPGRLFYCLQSGVWSGCGQGTRKTQLTTQLSEHHVQAVISAAILISSKEMRVFICSGKPFSPENAHRQQWCLTISFYLVANLKWFGSHRDLLKARFCSPPFNGRQQDHASQSLLR